MRYRIVVIFCPICFFACTQGPGVSPHLKSYTRIMEGAHTWYGWRESPAGNFDSFTFIQPISYVNDSTVVFWTRGGGTTQYHYQTGNDKTTTFTGNTYYAGGSNQDTLIFDYRRNIIYYNSYSEYNGQFAGYHLHTP